MWGKQGRNSGDGWALKWGHHSILSKTRPWQSNVVVIRWIGGSVNRWIGESQRGLEIKPILSGILTSKSTGNLVAIYRKLLVQRRHQKWNIERARFSELEMRIPPIDTPSGKLTADLLWHFRFGEMSTIFRKSGAEILTYPSAFSYSNGKSWTDPGPSKIKP